MQRLIAVLLGLLATFASQPAATANEAPLQEERAPSAWATPGTEWRVRVKQYSRAWGVGYSDPTMAARAQIPRVQHEFDMAIRVVGMEKSDDRTLARLEFIPGPDAPKQKYIGGTRYTLTIDTDTLHVVEAECTKGERVKIGKVTPWTVGTAADMHNTLFARVYGFPVDWVIEGDDMNKLGVECFLARRSPEVGATGHWEQINPTDLDQETPQTYRTEFRRTVTPTDNGKGIKVVVFRRDAFQETPSYEIEQVWDPKVGWWRSFKRTKHGHIDLEATLITE